jgi:nucleotide-binding universal stress UspA family protein
MNDRALNREESVKRVLVGVDGSEGSLRAANFARNLSKMFEAPLTLLHVIEPLPTGALTAFDEPMSDYYAKQMQWATDYLSALAKEIDADTTAEQVIEMGRPSDVICQEAHERGADMIVVGSHGRSLGSRLLLASVGSRVASNANRSVTIVR